MLKSSWKSFSRTETRGRETCPASSHRSLTRSVLGLTGLQPAVLQTPCPNLPELARTTQDNSWLTWSLGLVERTVSKEQALGVRQLRKLNLNLGSNLLVTCEYSELCMQASICIPALDSAMLSVSLWIIIGQFQHGGTSLSS